MSSEVYQQFAGKVYSANKFLVAAFFGESLL